MLTVRDCVLPVLWQLTVLTVCDSVLPVLWAESRSMC